MSVPAVTDDLGYSPGAEWIPGSQALRGEVRAGMPLSRQIATIREMLSMLDTLTAAGQRHSMSKIVGFVDQHVGRTLDRIGARNGSTLTELSTWLRHESQRTLPDVATFRRRADDLLSLLVAVG